MSDLLQGLRSIRPLSVDRLRGIVPAAMPGILPAFEWVDPSEIFVEDRYQRKFGENSIRLVRRIYAGFNWSRFKPPVCVRIPEWDNVLVCIDGQHTATAAASHPGIDRIPVMVVDAADMAARAHAFVGHNRERLGLTQMAIYFAELAAGDPVAVAIDQACKASGAEILTKSVNLRLKLTPGKSIAVGTIRAIARQQGAKFLTKVLKTLVDAERGPIKADEIAAVAMILGTGAARASRPAAGGGGDRSVDLLAEVIKSRSSEAWAAAAAQELAEKGGSLPDWLARRWAEETGVALAPGASSLGRSWGGTGRGGVASRLMARKPAAPLPPSERVPNGPGDQENRTSGRRCARPAPPLPAPKPPEAPQAVAITPVAGAKPERMMKWNGIEFDLLTRNLSHRGVTVRIHRDDGIRLMVGLARVMPALLDESRIAKTTFGVLSPTFGNQLRLLVEDIAPALARAKLEVKFIPKAMLCLRDLGE